MEKLVKANIVRLFKNKFLYVCFIIAVCTTFIVTKGDMEIIKLHSLTQSNCMMVVSGAIFGFLSIFVPIFEGVEYRNGVIRNKIIMGYSQKEVYFAHLIVNAVTILAIELLWFIAGVASGAKPGAELLVGALSLFFSCMAYAALVTFVLMRSRNTVVTIIISSILFYVSLMACLMTNFIATHVTGGLKSVSVLLENVNPVGQWFTHTIMCNDYYAGAGNELISYGIVPQLVLAVLVIALFTVLGTFKIENRNLK